MTAQSSIKTVQVVVLSQPSHSLPVYDAKKTQSRLVTCTKFTQLRKTVKSLWLRNKDKTKVSQREGREKNNLENQVHSLAHGHPASEWQSKDLISGPSGHMSAIPCCLPKHRQPLCSQQLRGPNIPPIYLIIRKQTLKDIQYLLNPYILSVLVWHLAQSRNLSV